MNKYEYNVKIQIIRPEIERVMFIGGNWPCSEICKTIVLLYCCDSTKLFLPKKS